MRKYIAIGAVVVLFVAIGATFDGYSGRGDFNVKGNLNVTGNISAANFPTQPTYVFYATVTQTGTSAPTMQVLVNTYGVTATWSRSSAGNYTLSFTGVASITSGNTIAFFTNGLSGTTTQARCAWNENSGDELGLQTYTALGVGADFASTGDAPASLMIMSF